VKPGKITENFNEFVKVLKDKKITHILFSEKGLKRMSNMSFIYKLEKKEYEKLTYYLFRLNLIYKDNSYEIFKL